MKTPETLQNISPCVLNFVRLGRLSSRQSRLLIRGVPAAREDPATARGSEAARVQIQKCNIYLRNLLVHIALLPDFQLLQWNGILQLKYLRITPLQCRKIGDVYFQLCFCRFEIRCNVDFLLQASRR